MKRVLVLIIATILFLIVGLNGCIDRTNDSNVCDMEVYTIYGFNYDKDNMTNIRVALHIKGCYNTEYDISSFRYSLYGNGYHVITESYSYEDGFVETLSDSQYITFRINIDTHDFDDSQGKYIRTMDINSDLLFSIKESNVDWFIKCSYVSCHGHSKNFEGSYIQAM